MRQMNNRTVTLNIDGPLSVAAIFLIIIYGSNHSWLALLPTIYFITELVFIRPLIISNQSKLVQYYRLFSFIRFVVLPIMMILTGNYNAGQSENTPNFNQAIVLMAWELIACTAFMAFYTRTTGYLRRRERFDNYPEINASDSNAVFWIFIVLAVGMAIMFPEALRQISFIVPRVSEVQEEAASTAVKLTVYVLSIAKNIMYIICIKYLKRMYDRSDGILFYFFSILVTLINVAVFFGTGRIAIVLSAVASLTLLNRMYPQKRRATNIAIAVMVLIVIVLISISRNVMMGVNNRSDFLYSLTSMIDAYLGGVHNVGVSIETSKIYAQEYAGVSSFVQEFLRYVVGISIMFKNTTVQTSGVLFNIVFSHNLSRVGQVIPILGVGYYYFGFLAAPILEMLFLYIGLRLENLFYSECDIYTFYCVSGFLLRIGMIGGQNPQLLTSNLVSYIVIPLIISRLNSRFVIGRKD